jgi:hypothetical protein
MGDKPALNANGTLKEAHELEFLFSPSDESCSSHHALVEPESPTPVGRGRQNANQSKFFSAMEAELMNSDDELVDPGPTTK